MGRASLWMALAAVLLHAAAAERDEDESTGVLSVDDADLGTAIGDRVRKSLQVHEAIGDRVRKSLQVHEATQSVLTIATLNIGGDGPQPEYIATDWDEVFGKVEISLGATILALYYCPDFTKEDACLANVKGTKFAGRYFDKYEQVLKEPRQRPEGFVSEMMLKTFNIKNDEWKALCKAADMKHDLTFRDFAVYMFDPETMPIVGKSTPKKEGDKAKAIGLSDIDRDASCKQRRSFPFFGEHFLEMGKALRENKFTVKWYTDSMENCAYKTGKFLPLLIFDLLVFDHFQALFSKAPLPAAITEPKVDEKKRELVQRLLPEVQVLMLQEAEAALVTPTKAGLVPAELQLAKDAKPPRGAVATATQDKKTKVISVDTAVLSTHELGTQDKSKLNLFDRWKKFVEATIKEDKDKQKTTVPDYRKPTQGPTMAETGLTSAPAVTIATSHVDGHRVLLLSMHPKSDGRPCVLYADMAKKFYDQLNQEQENFELLLVGGDWNVMTTQDKTEKLAKEKKDNDGVTLDPSDKNGFLWTEFAEAVGNIGFDIIHATKEGNAVATVKKVRSFLQTQFTKVAKVDETTKDVILAYPAKMVKTEEVRVLNTVVDTKGTGISGKFGLLTDKDKYFPTQNWILDHFAQYASITIDWTKAKAEKGT